MKRWLMGSVTGLAGLLAGFTLAADTAAQTGRVAVSVDVRVETTKANGQPWDVGGGAPDINICVIFPGSSSMECNPSRCQDQFRCRFSDVIWEAGSEIVVRDMDIADHDLIGRGRCVFGEQCFIDRATVLVGPN